MHRLWLVLRLVVSAVFCLVAGIPAHGQDAAAPQSPPPAVLTQGWQYRWGDSPTDDRGRPVWADEEPGAPGWQELTGLLNPEGRQGQRIVWFRVQLPPGRWPHPALLIPTLVLSGEVFLNGQRIYQIGTTDLALCNRYLATTWHLVPLPPDHAGGVLTLRIFSASDRFIGLGGAPRLGYQADVIRDALLEGIDTTALGVLFFFIGPLSLVFYLKRRTEQRVEYLSFGAFTTCVGLGPLLFSPVCQLFLSAPAWSYYLGFMAFFLFPVGMFAFLEQTITRGYWRIFRRLWQLHLAYASGALLLDVLGVVFLPTAQFVLLALLAVDVFITLGVGISAARRGNAEAKVLNLAGAVLGLSGLHDILMSYHLIPTWHQLFPWGTFVFVLLLGYILEHRFSENHRRLEERTDELSRTNQELHGEIAERLKAEEALRHAHVELEQLKDRLQEENLYLQEEIKLEHNFEDIITRSQIFKQVLRKVEQVASTDSTVLVLGETGTGKELLARAVHNISPRRHRPLVKVNCATLPSGLIESELFGHEKGAFTGALSRKTGRFELADGGTLFLDEIGDLPLELQAKLLRVLQEGEFERLGNPRTMKVDVRVIAATNRDLKDAMANGEFREDLYYRLNVFPIGLPPLRDRKEDIPLLVQHFVQRHAARAGTEIRAVSPRVMEALAAYHWPGNVRELEHVVERGVITSESLQLEPGDWLPKAESPAAGRGLTRLEDLEREHIIKVLETTGWRVSGERGAASILGLKRTTLEARMKKLGISRPR